MARARNIKPGFYKNDLLAEVHPLGRILFSGLWTIADREGRLEDRPKRIKAEILPYDDCNIDLLLNELTKRDFIIRYEADGIHYIQITNFLKHQNPHVNEARSEIPPPNEYSTSTVQEPEEHSTNRADSLLPITDSFIPIKDMSAEPEPQPANEQPRNINSKKEIREIMEFYNDQFKGLWKGPLTLTKEREAHIRQRLTKFTIAELKTAVVNLRASPFHCGENDKGKVYAAPEFLFKNDSQVDKWLKEITMKGGGNNGRHAEYQPDPEELEHRAELERIAEASKRRL